MSVEPATPSRPPTVAPSWKGIRGTVTTVCDGAAWGALVGAMALLPLQGMRAAGPAELTVNAVVDRAGGVLVSDVLFLVSAAFGAVALLDRGHRLPVPRLLRWGLLALAAGGALGLVTADQRIEALRLLGRLAAVVVVTLVVVWGARPRARRGRVVAAAYIGGATVSAVVGAWAVRAAGVSRFETPLGRAVGLAGNSGALAVVSVIGLALAVVLALETPSRAARAALAVAALALGLAVLDSGSRGALLAVGVLVVVVLVRLWRAGQRRAAVAGVAVAVAIAIGSLVGPLHSRAVDRLLLRDDRATNVATQRSTELRLEQYRLQLRARGWTSLMVGSGLQDLEPTASSMQEDDLRDPHNGHFEVWLGMGLLGLVGWGLVAVATVGPGVGMLTAGRPLRDDEALLAAAGTAYLAFAVLALTVNNVSNRYVWILVAWSAWLASRTGGGWPTMRNHGEDSVIRVPSEVLDGCGHAPENRADSRETPRPW